MTKYKVTVTTIMETDFIIHAETEVEASEQALKQSNFMVLDNIIEERFVTEEETLVENLLVGYKYRIKGNLVEPLKHREN